MRRWHVGILLILMVLASGPVRAQATASAPLEVLRRRFSAVLDSAARASPDTMAMILRYERALELADSLAVLDRSGVSGFFAHLAAAVPLAELRLALAQRSSRCEDARAADETSRRALPSGVMTGPLHYVSGPLIERAIRIAFATEAEVRRSCGSTPRLAEGT